MAENKEKITTGAIRVAGISVPDINAVLPFAFGVGHTPKGGHGNY